MKPKQKFRRLESPTPRWSHKWFPSSKNVSHASEKISIIFDRRVSKGILSVFASAISASSIARGTSFLKDKIGQQVFSNSINVIDNDLFLQVSSVSLMCCLEIGTLLKKSEKVHWKGMYREFYYILEPKKKI